MPSPDRVVTDGPPVVELFTPSGPAVTELDSVPEFFAGSLAPSLASSEWTTLHGLPLGPVVTVVLLETPSGPVRTVLV
ncbi:hypothetical protein CHKEEEPN_1528 [Methylorubrum podarium]|nr:hypothetical protein CHKEEEPN_1528 [Methylorubrum podarium]